MSNTIYHLLLNKRKFVEYEKRETPALKFFKESEKKLLASLSKCQLELFKDFKADFINQIEYILVEEGKYFLNNGIKIGQEIKADEIKIEHPEIEEK